MREEGVTTDAQGGVVLVAEDDPRILRVVTRALERVGYEVIAASSGVEALQIASERPGPIDFMVSDVVMPGMNGFKLAKAVSTRRPQIKILLMSGYFDRHEEEAEDWPRENYLSKPFSPGVLVDRVGALRRRVGTRRT